MIFDRLRLAGFKSFCDSTDFKIEAGLTGIVGPNGCGKSNLVDAFRWVMGENSYKSMRASEMDDVIFSGSDKRPSRNIAEVGLVLDNSDRRAPAAFNDSEVIEVTRRIARESGSTYRVNGREVRARDVQLLFADASNNTLTLIRNASTAPAPTPVPTASLLMAPAGLGVSPNGQWVLVANSADPSTVRVDLTAQTAPLKIACSCTPALVATVAGTATFRVTAPGNGPIWAVDAGASTPRSFFIPALPGTGVHP